MSAKKEPKSVRYDVSLEKQYKGGQVQKDGVVEFQQ